MLIPCVECGKNEYTEESPIWFHCKKCLYEKQEKLYKCVICLGEYDLKKTDFVGYCPKCAKVFKERRKLISRIVECKLCGQDMDYFLLHGEYDWLECTACGHSESAY